MIITILFFAGVLSGVYRSIVPFMIGLVVSMLVLSRQMYNMRKQGVGFNYKGVIENLQERIKILETRISKLSRERTQPFTAAKEEVLLTPLTGEDAAEVSLEEETRAATVEQYEAMAGFKTTGAGEAETAAPGKEPGAGDVAAGEEIPADEETEVPPEEVEKVKAEEAGEIKIEPPQPKVPGTWDKLQKKFIENWTGILGSIITVMGVAFFGVYLALKIAPLGRFMMITAFAGALFGLFLYLRSKPNWLQLALWLRSSAGAIFLFACVGAGGIKGLQWILNPLWALVVLCAGIAVNVYLGYSSGKQVFASLHVLLSLIALSIAPQSLTILIVATIVTLFGVDLTHREKWQYHLLLSISLFFIFHLYWYYSVGVGEISRSENLTAIIAVALVSVQALLVHYRSIYRTAAFEFLPFFVHFVNWFYFGIGLYLHSFGSIWKPIILSAGAAAAFFLARRARSIGTRWLYLTDTLAAQAIALFALYSLSRWKLVDPYFIVGMMFFETMLFLVIMIVEEEKLLSAVGTALKYALGAVLLIWAWTTLESSEITLMYRVLITLGLCLIFAAAFHVYLLKRFSKNYDSLCQTKGYEWLPFLLYFVYGFYAAGASYLFFLRWDWKAAAVAGLSAAAFVLGRYAKSLGQKALHVTGTLVGQGLALAAILALEYMGVDYIFILGLMFLETLLFLFVVTKGESKTLRRTGIVVLIILFIILLVITFDNLDTEDRDILFKNALTLSVCLFWATLFHLYTIKKYGEKFASFGMPGGKDGEKDYRVSWIGIFTGLLLVCILNNLHHIEGVEYIMAAVGVLFLYIRRRCQSNGLGIGLMFFLPWFFAIGWGAKTASLTMNDTIVNKLIYGFPYLTLFFAAAWMSYIACSKRHFKVFGIYLFYIQAAILLYYIFQPISPFAVGVSWLVLAVLTLELARGLRKKYGGKMIEKGAADRYLLHMSYLLTVFFLIRHIFLHLRTDGVIGDVSLRLAVALFALAVFVYWTIRKLPERRERDRLIDNLQPLFLELVFAFSILTIAVEVDLRWLVLWWIGGAIGCLILGGFLKGEKSRVRFYALLLFWASTVHVAILPHAGDWTINVAAIFLQFVFIVLMHRLPFLEGIVFPKVLGFLSPVVEAFGKKKNLWIHYPLFISVAIFLFQAFSRAVLTLLWVVECFAIFILSVILKENHFRYLAMTGLGLVLVRLFFYDLAKSDTLTRAVVFIGVGVIMLVIYSLFNKYKERF